MKPNIDEILLRKLMEKQMRMVRITYVINFIAIAIAIASIVIKLCL